MGKHLSRGDMLFALRQKAECSPLHVLRIGSPS